MVHFNRLRFGIAPSVVAVALGFAGCGSDDDKGTDTPPLAFAGTGGLAGSPAPAATAGVAAPVISTPVGTAGAAPVAPTRPSSATAGGPAAPVAQAGTSGAAVPPVAQPTTPGGTWDEKAALDPVTGKLIPPAAGQGFQIATPTFELKPGQEIFKCFRVAVPTDAVFPVGEWDAQMSPGSHHFILYRAGNDAQATKQGVLSNSGCTQGFGGTTWLYTQGGPRGHLQFPEGVAMELTPGEKINFDLHYINTTQETKTVQVILNVNRVKAEKYLKADAQISFNVGIAVPPHGTQKVSGYCVPVPGAKYIVMQTHTHKYATLATINRKLANGMMGEELVRTTDWDSPTARVWEAEPFLTFKDGEQIAYSCEYKNDTASTITVGVSAEKNEMCMAEAYYFPASPTTPVCR